MPDLPGPKLYSIAAHRGFADALVAGLVPRYADKDTGLAKLTLLLPSSRAMRTMSEAFIRHFGASDAPGLLMPRMAVIGDLDLDETLGPLLDPLGAGGDIAPAADPTRRWLRLAELIGEERSSDPVKGSALLRLAFEAGRAMDRLLVEEIRPEQLLERGVLDFLGDLAGHWQDSLRIFARVQLRWLAELQQRGEQDAAARRNALFRLAAKRWKADPPATPIVAAGVTSAAPALAKLLRVVADLPQGAVVLPDLDLSMPAEVWEELGSAGAPDAETPLARGDAVTHPQYHLKLLLNRMGVARDEVQHWHRAGMGKGPPERSHAISSLFLPPEASKAWVDLPPERRRLSGVRLMQSANPEEEAQAIALMVRETLEEKEKRVAVVTPDRGLAARVVQHLRRWNIEADDTAGRPLSQTPAGRLFLLLAEVGAENAAPVPLVALLQHPLVRRENGRSEWLEAARKLEKNMRGPRPAPGIASIGDYAKGESLSPWWAGVEGLLAPLFAEGEAPLADQLDRLATVGEELCGASLWEREDGRALSAFIEELRLQARDVGTMLDPAELPAALRDAMERVAVRPPYGGHPRVAVYGLLESRMTRADLVICAGLNHGSWPGTPAADPLLAPPVLRALGVPGNDFRIGLAAHDLAGALGAPEIVLSRSERDASGPAIASRFWLRVRALLGEDLVRRHEDQAYVTMARALDDGPAAKPHGQPRPVPTAEQRKVDISVTALDTLRGDPFQFYARRILGLNALEALDARPSPAWQGTLAHEILRRWHQERGDIYAIAQEELQEMNAHPLMRGLWQPRLFEALKWVAETVGKMEGREVIATEKACEMIFDGVRIHGRVDRIDRLANGSLAVVDYKTGSPPSAAEVAKGYRLQLGLTGLIVEAGGVENVQGDVTAFEYWSLAKQKGGDGFGYADIPLKVGKKSSGLDPEDFLPETRAFLHDAIAGWILGDRPFTARPNPDFPGYNDYDQLMRLDEWMGREE
ncbi:ATP-dependent helicase/nuclease subunit B [Altererythrobacter atlanticus]|uniref:ATP-dependent helicase/deoxyribonuclease subunit B n=1 Tax=Croceibacterium atlanticum TaxID=1267766 RepID=A0A0F7KSM2_9SPHN|nr:PD-(D/E)XK nuclease family protein [Croceibacterium atlanticum]AKH41760.1 ATP-dependent helicase/deoxyribonuclease subunit B [Croceibacterium atlanticum]MBB5733225.1 ATP-dependent helicase/nuclease subunit B [Croceibacterium atlanticum]